MNTPAAQVPLAMPRQAFAGYGLLGLPLAFVALPVYVQDRKSVV